MNKEITKIRIIFIALVLMFLNQNFNAQKRITTDFKDYNFEVFEASDITNIIVNSMHADISIMNWEKDSVSVETTLEILSDKPNLSKEMMEEININVSTFSKTVKVKTEIGSDFHSTIPYKIVYTIFCPERLSLNINNQHGNVTIGKILGGTNASIENCTVNINQIATADSIPGNQLSLSFCTGSINNIGRASASINNSNLSIGKADSLTLNSSYNTLNIGRCMVFKGNSNIDNIEIQLTDQISVQGENSLINIGQFNKIGLFELTNGTLNITNSNSDIQELTINNNNTKTTVHLNPNASYTINGEVKWGKLTHPQIEKIKIIEDNNTQSFNGEIGSSPNQSQAKVIIFNQKQNVNFQ